MQSLCLLLQPVLVNISSGLWSGVIRLSVIFCRIGCTLIIIISSISGEADDSRCVVRGWIFWALLSLWYCQRKRSLRSHTLGVRSSISWLPPFWVCHDVPLCLIWLWSFVFWLSSSWVWRCRRWRSHLHLLQMADCPCPIMNLLLILRCGRTIRRNSIFLLVFAWGSCGDASATLRLRFPP